MKPSIRVTVIVILLALPFGDDRICKGKTTTQTSPATTPKGYTVVGNAIYKNGNPIHLLGVNWFGFETKDHVVHGLWARNFRDMILQIKSLGFNAIRIPFCPKTLEGFSVSGIDYSINPDLVRLNSLEVLDRVLLELDTQRMYVLLDHHYPDCSTVWPLWYTATYSEAQWIADLKFVAERYQHLEHFVGLDLKTEPRGSATWGTGNGSTDWNLAAERAGRSVLAVNPNILIFVEGVEENPICSSTTPHWWGGNLEPQKCTPISKIPANKVVLSPHVYGPDVYLEPYFRDRSFPENMPAIWEQHFGYLIGQGKVVVPGEFGGKYGHRGDPRDVVWQNKIVDYFIEKKICNFFYWAWNPNSTDTGGLLQNDWRTIWKDKYNNLYRLISSCKN